MLLEQWDTGWVDSLTGWAAAGHRWVAGAVPSRQLQRSAGSEKQPAGQGCSLTRSRTQPAMRSLCCYPMGKRMVTNSCQKGAVWVCISRCSPAGGDWRRGRAGGRRLVCSLSNRARLRIAGLRPGDGYSGASRKGACRDGPSARHSGCCARPEPKSRKSRRLTDRSIAKRRATAVLQRKAMGPPAWRYLVDPASSHMLVSKIKPCMSKYKLLYTVKLRMAH